MKDRMPPYEMLVTSVKVIEDLENIEMMVVYSANSGKKAWRKDLTPLIYCQ